ncbi:hypothetical protein [Arsenicicoccus sp. oral taxon 190]|uniref:hypothetical protein n=1 Tax=Arsenicicoccus sp. oral taxon 190 TaxID=1658671 RepID=UPI0012E31721|nr:hypothetical protein [Arsenicicoccus sp. oral taxon 190]
MTDPISREHEPSGFGRVFGAFLALLATVGVGWAATRGRDRDPVTARRREAPGGRGRSGHGRGRDGSA